MLRHGLALLRAPAIEVSFALRSSLRWSRGTPGPDALAGAPTFAWAPALLRPALEARAAELEERYAIAARTAGLAPELRARNYARLEQLERLSCGLDVPRCRDGVVRAADLGCGDFHYAPALSRWLTRSGPDVALRTVLRGLEFDGYGVYRDGFSRADHGRARAAASSTDGDLVRFEVADATAARLPPQDVVTLQFPFLTPYACLNWRAPLSRLRPRRMLRRAVAALRPGGWLVVLNQTPREHALLARWLARAPVTRLVRRRLGTDLSPDAPQTVGQIGSIWLRGEIPAGGANWVASDPRL